MSSHQEGDDTIAMVHVIAELTGILQGTLVSDETAVVHADGSIDVSDVETLTGTVNGIEGTVVFRELGTIDAAGAAHAGFWIVDASDGLAGLHGCGSLDGANGVTTYEVRLEFPHRWH